MNSEIASPTSPAAIPVAPTRPRGLTVSVAAGALAWLVVACGFLGLRVLMQERPQFVGPPMRSSMMTLVQESPRVVFRPIGDDVAAIRPLRPELSEVSFDLQGQRDHRGLKTLVDMAGTVVIRHVLTNALGEPVFVLFRSPHPRADDGTGPPLQASALRLRSSVPGTEENARGAWLWTGELAANSAMTIEVSYRAAALKSVSYRMTGAGEGAAKQLRVGLRRTGLEALRIETGEGALADSGGPVNWERRDFLGPDGFTATIVEERNLHDSLLQLLEIGPLVCLLFLVAVAAVVGLHRPLTAAQLLTLTAGHALYFPLMVYLSARFSFAAALALAAVVPGGLLLNYARVQWGNRLGWVGGPLALGLYQIFPTWAAFAGWNRGMVLLCLGMVTFAVLIQLQNRTLNRAAAALAVMGGCLLDPGRIRAAEVQVLLPAQLAPGWPETNRCPAMPLLSFAPATYEAVHRGDLFEVEARVPFEVLRSGDAPVPLFTLPVHLRSQRIDSDAGDRAFLATLSNGPALLASGPGRGTLRLSYRVRADLRDGRRHAEIPLLPWVAAEVRIVSPRADLQNLTGSPWSRQTADGRTAHEFGVAGEDRLSLEWRDNDDGLAGTPPTGTPSLYGIGITLAQHLTVIGSDGSCTHFAEFDLPAAPGNEFRLGLPSGAKLVSVSVNGVETAAPPLEGSVCRLRLPEPAGSRTTHRISFRLANPAVKLGFAGIAELALPETFLTAGSVRWAVALPAGFVTQVIASGLEAQKSPAELSRFGDYARVVNPGESLHFAKELAPPGPVALSVRYRQTVPGWE